MELSDEVKKKRNTDAQRKFRLTHPNYGRKYPERQQRYYQRQKAKNAGVAITSDIAIKHKVKKTSTEINKRDSDFRKSYYKKLKITVLTHYGGGKLSCVQCGESRIECLSIDHINGHGNEHRREILKTRYCSGTYNWLRKNCFPEGFQTLCMNCQFVKRVTNKELIKSNNQTTPINTNQPQLPFIIKDDNTTSGETTS